ncbi:hypothetical protein SLE2022_158230 [Rubroshorea leprosula]
MFGGAWSNIAKSAEAVVSQWAARRLFKFLLKKKLGQFILGDIDLDQLDVQLSNGTVQLSDLALNVDYLNSKFGTAASMVIKEGSIGSFLVKMPWKGKGCDVEIDELELVVAPCMVNNLSAPDENCNLNEDDKHAVHSEMEKLGNDMADNAGRSMSGDVHEGVKTIAKMVKWFLTSFHIKIKKLIVAFDPYMGRAGREIDSHRTLVLRISEVECGTCISEDGDLKSEAKESFLGISQLTNFVRFQGAVLELLHMDDVDDQSRFPCTSGTTFAELFSGCHPSNATTPIMMGKTGGFSGNLKLSIPCKNGSLDIRKVDADVYMDPVELRFQPSTIKWFLLAWETYKDFDMGERGHRHQELIDSLYLTSNSQLHSSMPASNVIATDKVVSFDGCFSAESSSLNKQELASEALLPGAHLIPDWVPFSVSKDHKGSTGEVDFGASVDHFFECFDGIRSFQTALGSSGMWNWTCSVFSAITAASSLASGSLHLPSEQQHVQTNLKATFAGISIILSFHDEDQNHTNEQNGHRIHGGSNVHYLGAECSDIFLLMQVCPREMRLDGTMKHIEVADYLCKQNDVCGCSDPNGSQTLLLKNLQAEVQRTLPSFSIYEEDTASDELCGLFTADFPFSKKGDVIKNMLFRTFAATHCQFVKSSSSDDNFSGTTLISLKLPPLIFWLNFCSTNLLLDLLKEVGESTEMNYHKNALSHDVCNDQCESSHGHVKRASGPHITTLSSIKTVRGDISIPNARIILCFPFKSGGDDGGYSSWNQFIALDISSPSNSESAVIQDTRQPLDRSLERRVSSIARHSLHLNIGNLDIYLVTPSHQDDSRFVSCGMQPCKFSAEGILSVSNRTGCFSVISVLWQEGPATGPWIADKAKLLATQEETRNRNKCIRKDYEFATVTTLRDLEDKNFQTKEEIILSSSFLIHIHLFPVKVNLGISQYNGLHCLLNQMTTEFSCLSHGSIDAKDGPLVSQTSFLLECESVEISIRQDAVGNVKRSMQSELPGSWSFLNLKVQKFVLLSVSNIGGINDAGFLWIAHGEGTLSGSVTEVPDQEFLLISCSNSTMKRGDGSGSNALSSRPAGSDIVFLWDPKSLHGFTSISVRCSTIVALGGRLDWLESIALFFSLPSQDLEPAVDGLHEGHLDVPHGASFVLSLVDAALSYEPYFRSPTVSVDVLASETGSSNPSEGMVEPHVACILAASSLKLSNRTAEYSKGNEYKIRVQDLGLLLRAVSEHEKLGGMYSVQHLQEIGYVKVASEALMDVVFKTNCENGLQWELECSKSQIYVETCHDTTNGMVRLAAQLQQLFAPDVEESLGHLQTRWNNVQQAQQKNGHKGKSGISYDSDSSTSQLYSVNVDNESNCAVVGLMDEICEDAFNLDGNQTCQFESSLSQFHAPLVESFIKEACSLSFDGAETFSYADLESSETSFLQEDYIPEIIDSYCLSKLRPLSELSAGGKLSQEVLKSRSIHTGNEDFGIRNCGWYRDASLRIVENHISDASEEASLNQMLDGKFSSSDHTMIDDIAKVVGCVLLRNINVRWKMYAGSDWHVSLKNGDHSTDIHGSDRTLFLELVLSGVEFKYDIFPAGGESVSKLSLSVLDFHLSDRSRAAPWQLVLGYYNSKDHPRESSSKAFQLDLEAVRPDPLIPLEEYRLRIAFLPMLLHFHQSQLDFLRSFFGEKSLSTEQSSVSLPEPSLTVRSNNIAGHTIAEEALLPYFQKFEILPIRIRVDYSPHHVDIGALKGGRYVELINLVPLKGIELKLKHVNAVGIYGWGGVCETIIEEWLEDISQNQIHKVLRGLPTIRSLLAVGAGAAKLISEPLESYRKDQRVLKGIQRGTIAFLRSISIEAVGLGLHLAAGAHDILLQAEYLFTSSPPVSWHLESKMERNVRYNQPKDAQQGIQQAYESISDGLEKSATALVRTPLKQYQRGASARSVLATAVRGVPTAAIAPASGFAGAIHTALFGMRNSLDPERKKESMEKYLGPTQPQDQN